MSRVVFSASATPSAPADYYKEKCGNTYWWMVQGKWYMMFPDGSCSKAISVYDTPFTDPNRFEPGYGAFTITINPFKKD